MNKNYEKELEDLRLKMEKAEKFAEKMPFFKGKILNEKLTGEEHWKSYGDRYKEVPLGWDLVRGWFNSNTNRHVTNLNKAHDIFCWKVYINTLSLYNSSERYGLDEIPKSVPVYYYDRLNSTFYFTDDQFISVMNNLNHWYMNAVLKNESDRRSKKIKELKQKEKAIVAELEALKGN